MIQLVAHYTCRQLDAEVPILAGDSFLKDRIGRGKMQEPQSTENNDPLLDELKEALGAKNQMYVEARILQIQVFEMKQLWGCLNWGFSNDGRKMDLV